MTLTVATPSIAAASTTNDLEHDVLDLINDARTDRGLRPFRAGKRLWLIAGYRAGRMASTNVLSHSVAGSISSQLKAKSVPWYGYGENIGYTRSKPSKAAIKHLFAMWKASPSHWKLMMSSKYNYIGVGIAYRSSNTKSFSSLIFTESPDLSKPKAAMDGASYSGTNTAWAWHGYDPVLQTHTSGLKSFDIQTRVDSGDWRTAASKTTSTSRAWNGLSRGHTYGMRVRARDKAGNVGAWSSELRLRIP